MKVAISVVRPFHVALMANALLKHRAEVVILSSAPRSYFRGLDAGVSLRVIPAPMAILQKLLPFRISEGMEQRGIAVWDRMVAAVLPEAETVIGFATQTLATERRAGRRGARFVLDRACPHVEVQQRVVEAEAAKVGARFEPQPAWFRERQLEEYGLADAILVPSAYTAGSFAGELRKKVVIAPLLGRAGAREDLAVEARVRDGVFTVGVLGGNPLRKGYLYLLEAWKNLGLPKARLLIRNQSDFAMYPRLADLLQELPNAELVGYVDDIGAFYRRCDVFCLPSVDDGFGMALCEAMAEGVACVATDRCGASELMTDGVDGLVVRAGDSEALAGALLRLYGDEEMRRGLGEAGRETMERVRVEGRYEKGLAGAVFG